MTPPTANTRSIEVNASGVVVSSDLPQTKADFPAATLKVNGLAVSGVDFAARKILTVSKGTAATNTRTGLSPYDETRPFVSLSAAVAAATSGDTIIVWPGAYNETDVAKDGVNIILMRGAKIAYTGSSLAPVLQDATGVPVTLRIDGEIVDTRTTDHPMIQLLESGSVLRVHGDLTGGTHGYGVVSMAAGQLFLDGDVYFQGGNPCVYQGAGEMRLRGSVNSRGSTALYQNGGQGYTEAHSLRAAGALNAYAVWGDGTAVQNVRAGQLISESTAAIYWQNAGVLDLLANVVQGTRIIDFGFFPYDGATCDLTLRAGRLIATSASDTAIDWTSREENAPGDMINDQALWVAANIIRCAGGIAAIREQVINDEEGTPIGSWPNTKVKVYITAQKAVGAGALPAFAIESGRFWSNIDKLTASHVFLLLTGGESWHDIRLMEVGTTAAQFAVDVSGGTHVIKNARFIGGASNKGFNISGGTLILENCHIDTSANSSTNPITKSGGTLILKNTSLVAHSSRDSITAATAQNVKVYGTAVANKAKNANVTIQVGTLTVDTNVN